MTCYTSALDRPCLSFSVCRRRAVGFCLQRLKKTKIFWKKCCLVVYVAITVPGRYMWVGRWAARRLSAVLQLLCLLGGRGCLGGATRSFSWSLSNRRQNWGLCPGHLSRTPCPSPPCPSPEHPIALGSCHFHCDSLTYNLPFLFDSSMQAKDEIAKVLRGYQEELGTKAPLKFPLRSRL